MTVEHVFEGVFFDAPSFPRVRNKDRTDEELLGQ